MSTGRLAILDVDETMANLRTQVERLGRERFGLHRPWEGWHVYSFPDIYPGVSVPQWHAAMIEERSLELAEVEPGVHDAVRKLQDRQMVVEGWTCRAWHPNAAAVTQDWLMGMALQDIEVRLFEMEERKGDRCRRLGIRPAFAADDSPSQLRSIREASPGTFCALIDRPWNRAESGFRRVFSLRAAVDLYLEMHAQPVLALG